VSKYKTKKQKKNAKFANHEFQDQKG